MPSLTAPTLRELQEQVIAFRDARDWRQFHNPKDVAVSLALEAAEVLEHFQWKTSDEARDFAKANPELGDELADVLYWILLMAHDAEIDLAAALATKLAKNGQKYPVDKSRGSRAKYTEL